MGFKIYLVVTALYAVFILHSCETKLAPSAADNVKSLYTQQIVQLQTELDTLLILNERNNDAEFQKQFLKCRLVYKAVEPFVEYYNPSTAKAINGPALLEVEPDNPEYPVNPSGFQVVEEHLFPTVTKVDREILTKDLKALQASVQRASVVNIELDFTDKAIFDALRLQLFRLQTLGITGFDSPIAFNSIEETKAGVNSISQYLSLYDSDSIRLWQKDVTALNTYLNGPVNFNDLDRAYLLTRFFIPMGSLLNSIQEDLKIPYFNESRPLKANAANLFEKDAFNASYYSPTQKQRSDSTIVSLGKALFFESKLSSNGKRNCGSCHNPEKAFSDGIPKNKSFDGKSLILRNTPTILYSGLQSAQFADSRISFLEDQVKQVAENPLEMHGNLKHSLTVIQDDPVYKKKIQETFPNQKVTELEIQQAIAAYIRSKNAFNSRFDLYMQGQKTQLNTEEVKGFNLFMGKGKCGTCHFMPLFNGSFPPAFIKSESEVLGVPMKKNSRIIDADVGKYSLYKSAPHKFSFKTPTLRNVMLTAPYMHNGVFDTMEEVMEFYNNGGGTGIGIELDNQTLPPDALELTAKEQKEIIAFLNTLSDRF